MRKHTLLWLPLCAALAGPIPPTFAVQAPGPSILTATPVTTEALSVLQERALNAQAAAIASGSGLFCI